jgi:hypothetical protein
MKFPDLLAVVSEQSFFETGLLLAGQVNPDEIRRQLSRWVKAGRILQLRRGLYVLAAPYQHSTPHTFLLSNALLPGSYISLQSALAYYGLIPELVTVTLAVTVRRPAAWHTPLGDFRFHHLAPHLNFGYRQIAISDNHSVFIATPEKALLDLVHLTPAAENPAWLAEMRLQNLDQIDLPLLHQLAASSGKPRWLRAADAISDLARADTSSYQIV